jgi:hypothetical protein
MIRQSVLCVAVFLAGMGAAVAQEAPVCPQLPAGAALTWDYRSSGNTDLCRALRPDGSEAFGLVISPKPTFEPQRSDRAERSRVDGREVTWYRAELAQKPGVQARETVVELADGRSAHLWLQAANADSLQADLELLQSLRFGPGGPQVASGQ